MHGEAFQNKSHSRVIPFTPHPLYPHPSPLTTHHSPLTASTRRIYPCELRRRRRGARLFPVIPLELPRAK